MQAAAGLALFGVVVVGRRPGLSPVAAAAGVAVDAGEWIRVSEAPMGPNGAVAVMAAAGLWLLTMAADTLVVGLGRPALIVVPLLVPFAIPALLLETPGGAANFGLLVLGFGAVLLADGWNRTVLLRANGVSSPTQRRSLLVGGLGTLVAAALIAALAGGLPQLQDRGRWEPGSGSGPLQMADPSLDMKRNLELPADRLVISYRTDRDSGAQLRLAALPRFDEAGWHLDQTEFFPGALPPAEGLRGGLPRQTTVTLEDFRTQWLPLPYAPRVIDLPGDWRHNPASLGVLWAAQG